MYVYISIYIISACMYMYQRVRLRSSHAGLQWHVACCIHTILVYRCNKQGSHVLLSIQFDTNVSQLLRRVLSWSCDPLPSLGELSSSRLNRLSVCLTCLFWLCIPPAVYGRPILCLLCLRVVLFSEEKKNGLTSDLTRGWRPASDVSPTPPDSLTSGVTTKTVIFETRPVLPLSPSWAP